MPKYTQASAATRDSFPGMYSEIAGNLSQRGCTSPWRTWPEKSQRFQGMVTLRRLRFRPAGDSLSGADRALHMGGSHLVRLCTALAGLFVAGKTGRRCTATRLRQRVAFNSSEPLPATRMANGF